MEQLPEWAGIATTRQGLYRLFGRVLLPPEEGLTQTLEAAAGYLEKRGLMRFPFYPHWSRFRVSLDHAPSTEALATTYVRLFASGVNGALCPPTESWYKADARGGGIAELVATVERDYRVLGFAPLGVAEPPDHAATELESMSGLCAREAVAWEARRDHEAAMILEGEERFLRARLATWFGDFAARVETSDAGGWYHAAIDATNAFIIQDVDLVRALRRQLVAP